MFSRIVVGTDGSETAKQAVREATELAKQTGASLDIVSAYDPVPSSRLREERLQAPSDIEHAVNRPQCSKRRSIWSTEYAGLCSRTRTRAPLASPIASLARSSSSGSE